METKYLLFPIVLAMFLLTSCKNNNTEAPNYKFNVADIVHIYSISSTAGIEVSLIASSGGQDISVNGVSEKSPFITKTVLHTGVSEYKINCKDQALVTTFVVSTAESAVVNYTWKEVINGKETKSDKGTLSINDATTVQLGKMYSTYVSNVSK